MAHREVTEQDKYKYKYIDIYIHHKYGSRAGNEDGGAMVVIEGLRRVRRLTKNGCLYQNPSAHMKK